MSLVMYSTDMLSYCYHKSWRHMYQAFTGISYFSAFSYLFNFPFNLLFFSWNLEELLYLIHVLKIYMRAFVVGVN